MTNTRRVGALLPVLAIGAALAGCSVQLQYQPNETALDGIDREQREQLFAETISRALKPRIYQVWIDDSSYGYDTEQVMRDGFGVPVAYSGRRRIVYFANVRELRLYDNNAVFVVDTSGRVVDKLRFGYRDDAARLIDLIAAYRAQRFAGAGSPGPGRDMGHRYDRRYEPRHEEPYDERYDDRDDYDERDYDERRRR